VGLVTQIADTAGAVVPSKNYGIMGSGATNSLRGPESATPARVRTAWMRLENEPGDVAVWSDF